MSAASRLWHRALLWRLSLYSTVFFLGLAAFFPTPALLKLAPWLTHLPGSGAHKTETASSVPNDSTPAAPNNNPNAPLPANRVGAPDINTALSGSVPFGGHTLPLPAGIWHPVLSGQVGPDGSLLVTIMVRTDRGIVTGVTVARTSSKPMPPDGVDAIENPCHDDRNYASQIVSEGNNGILECWRVSRAVLDRSGSISTDPLIDMAFERLRTLGFPIPSLFVVTSWIHAAKASDSNGVNTAVVDTLIAPTQPGTIRLLAPLQYWDKETLQQAPAAEGFIHDTTRWMKSWTPILHTGLTAGLPAGIVPTETSTDPAAPRL